MRIASVAPALLDEARSGELRSLDALLVTIQPGVYNLAVRMLGNRDDARDATQEILLKVTTHLGSFRGESAFTTWVFRVAKNHLLTAATRTRESPEVSYEALEETLKGGIELGRESWPQRSIGPDDKLEAREMAVACTQGMLMRLDRDHRIAYVLDLVFGLPSEEAAEVLEISAAAYRKRVSRARQALDGFSRQVCGLVNETADCRCEKQVHAVRILAAQGVSRPNTGLRLDTAERKAAGEMFDRVVAMSDMAVVIRSHPDYQAPGAMIEAIRAVVAGQGRVA